MFYFAYDVLVVVNLVAIYINFTFRACIDVILKTRCELHVIIIRVWCCCRLLLVASFDYHANW